MSKIVFLKSLLVASIILFSTTAHEFVHLLVGRLLGIPSVFLNLTAAGIPPADKNPYNELYLCLMNGAAPAFSVLVLGLIPLIFLFKKYSKSDLVNDFCKWLVVLNIPYIATQMLFCSTPPNTRGAGNDLSSVVDYLGGSILLRCSISFLGFFTFLVLIHLIARSNIFGTISNSFNISKLRKCLAAGLFTIGIFLVGLGNFLLFKGMQKAVPLILLGAFMLPLVSYSLLIDWKKLGVLRTNLFLPALIGSFIVFPLGFLGNDYLIFPILVLVPTLGILYGSAPLLTKSRS